MPCNLPSWSASVFARFVNGTQDPAWMTRDELVAAIEYGRLCSSIDMGRLVLELENRNG
jgi:hypothetical protein